MTSQIHRAAQWGKTQDLCTSQYAEWDLNKTSSTLTETLTALLLNA